MSIEEFVKGIETSAGNDLLSSVAALSLDKNIEPVLEAGETVDPWSQW